MSSQALSLKWLFLIKKIMPLTVIHLIICKISCSLALKLELTRSSTGRRCSGW